MKTRTVAFWTFAAAGWIGLGTLAWQAQKAPPAGAQPPAKAGDKPAAGKPGGPPGGMAMAVESAGVAVGVVEDRVAAVGTLRALDSVVLRPEIAGRIARIGFSDGQTVRRGAVLVDLDDATLAAELAQARANLGLAEANAARTEDLFQRQFVSARSRDEAAAQLAVQRAAVQLAEARLARTRIRAPFDGVVGLRDISVGHYVKDGQDLVHLESIAALKVDFRLPERFFGQIKVGQTLTLSTDARPGIALAATVDAIDPLIDAAGRAVSLRARVANAEGFLRPGMFARVELTLGRRDGALLVPEEALVPNGQGQTVFRIVDGKAQGVAVEIGQRFDGKVEIRKGLGAGDRVVTAGQIKLRPGAPVRELGAGTPGGETPAGAPAGKPDAGARP